MDTIAKIYTKARSKLKTILLPEYDDARIQDAAKVVEKKGLARVLLLSPDKIKPADRERYIQEFYLLRKHKGMDLDTAKKLFENPLYSAAMMTRLGEADGFVAGASHTTPDVARAAIWCLGVDEHIGLALSVFIMVVPNSAYGEEGTFVFADCGIVPNPDSRQLASIALAAAEFAKKVLEFVPRVALLSYSTKGSAKGENVKKIVEALSLLKENSPGLLVDGEMQADAAIVPEVAKIKSPESPVAGRANVLIFPNLEAGNIGYKLVQRLSNARAVGPLLLGLNKPCSDLSRGCLVEDIVDTVAAIAVMS